MNVVLVDDHQAYRQSLRIALSKLTTMKVVGEAGNARDGCVVIKACKPDIAVVDFMLGDSDGVSMARELQRQRVRTPIVMLGRLPHPSFLGDAVRMGVRGYILKTEPLERVLQAIDTVAAGNRYFSPELERALQEAPTAANDLDQLSRREREVLCLLMEGHSSKDIARSLYISVRTVDAHRLHINRKLGVRSPSMLTHLLAARGLIAG